MKEIDESIPFLLFSGLDKHNINFKRGHPTLSKTQPHQLMNPKYQKLRKNELKNLFSESDYIYVTDSIEGLLIYLLTRTEMGAIQE
jgi:hypothetical protein